MFDYVLLGAVLPLLGEVEEGCTTEKPRPMGFSSGAAFLFCQDADNVEHFLHKGPDIVARNPATGKTVIVSK